MRSFTSNLSLAFVLLVLAACEGEFRQTALAGPGLAPTLARTFHGAWTYTAWMPDFDRLETGTCFGEVEITRQAGERFEGAFTVPQDRTCIPTHSGALTGTIASDGDFRLRLELPEGGFGVFRTYPNCATVFADEAVFGAWRDGELRGSAEALFTCDMLGFGPADIHLTVRLNAAPLP